MRLKLFDLFKIIYRLIFYTPEKYAKLLGVKIGDDCWINTRHFGAEPYLITIGNHVQITKNVQFITHGGGYIFRNEIPDLDYFGKIVLKDNIYIGTDSIILPGVTIESNVIVAAGSVVTKSVPSGTIVGGNPARIIGNVYTYKTKILGYNLHTKNLNPVDKRKAIESADDSLFIKKPFLE